VSADELTTRSVPQTRWGAAWWLAVALVVAAVGAWEWRMRSLGLQAGDLDDSKSHWAVERRKVAAGEHDNVVIIGSSRILFDTDLAAWEEMTGRKPIQLALAGTNPRPFLHDFAEHSDFSGLLVVGVTPDLFYTDWLGIPEFAGLLQFWNDESPSQRFGHRVGLELSRHLAFLDSAYRLGTLIDRGAAFADREGVRGPVRDVWKLWWTSDDRQTFLWSRIETDERLREHARWVWGPFTGEPVEQDLIDRVIDEVRQDVGKIRARGGEVVFIRCPSAELYYESESWSAPRSRIWEPLLEKTGAFGFHFEDYQETQRLEVPEWSHLSRDSARRFTQTYVGALVRELPWLVESRPAE